MSGLLRSDYARPHTEILTVPLEGRRRLLGVSVALSEAEVHWRAFLDSLIAPGLRGVEFVVSDDHAGLRAARQAVLPAAKWQRCQFYLAQNAIHHAPSLAIRKRIGSELRAVWNAHDPHAAQAELNRLVEGYAEKAPKLARWLETNVPEGLAVFALPASYRRRMRTSPIERAVQQEIKRRTRKVRVFPNEDSLLRLVTPPSPRSMRNGPPPTASTSTWTTGMAEPRQGEFPYDRLLNLRAAGAHLRCARDRRDLHGRQRDPQLCAEARV